MGEPLAPLRPARASRRAHQPGDPRPLDRPALAPASGTPVRGCRRAPGRRSLGCLWGRDRVLGGTRATLSSSPPTATSRPEPLLGAMLAPAETTEAYWSLAHLLEARGLPAATPLTVASDGAAAIRHGF